MERFRADSYSPSKPLNLDIERDAEGIKLQLAGEPGTSSIIQFSSDAENWVNLTPPIVLKSESAIYRIKEALDGRLRSAFYRTTTGR